MKIRERKFIKCKSCLQNVKQIQEDAFGCDECQKEIDLYNPENTHLRLQIFQQHNSTDEKQFCSWKCVFKYLPKVKSDYFVTLPFLHYENDTMKGQSVKDFLKLIKRGSQ